MNWQCIVGYLMCAILFGAFSWVMCLIIKEEEECSWLRAAWFLFRGYVGFGILFVWVIVIIRLFETGNCY